MKSKKSKLAIKLFSNSNEPRKIMIELKEQMSVAYEKNYTILPTKYIIKNNNQKYIFKKL